MQTTPSDSLEHPFQAGQIIAVETLTPAMRAAVQAGAAVLLDAEPAGEPEAAVLEPSERAVLPRPKKHQLR